MSIKIYILGILKKYGSLHGYKIQKIVSSQMGPVTRLKPSNIYYHLQKMSDKGYLQVKHERDGNYPERFIYAITDCGKKYFNQLVNSAMHTEYIVESKLDSAIYFLDLLNNTKIKKALLEQEAYLSATIKKIQSQRKNLYTVLKDEDKTIFKFLIEHQLIHYRAELKWIKKLLADFE